MPSPPSVKPVVIHMPSLVEGESLCGHFRARESRLCESCFARSRVLREVHIQSRRDPNWTFCGRNLDLGLLLGGGGIDRIVSSEELRAKPPLMFVRPPEARLVIGNDRVASCETCRDNFLRSEDYLMRSSGVRRLF